MHFNITVKIIYVYEYKGPSNNKKELDFFSDLFSNRIYLVHE